MTLPSFGHVLSISDGIGIFEHADHAVPRRDHGYCTDDMARLLVAIVREPTDSQELRDLSRTALRFLALSQSTTGRTRNRCDTSGRWHGRYGVEDCWGRSLLAFGSAARRAPEEWMRSSAASYFDHGVAQRSPHRRSMAFAALGAVDILETNPRHHRAQNLLSDAIATIGAQSADVRWPWPEPRLTYANAALAEALIAAGNHLDRAEVVEDGLVLLRWLLDRETFEGHLSPTPVGGSGPHDHAPMFDQQPIEVAAMADACARALAVTGDDEWGHGVDLAIAWFGGGNDRGAQMWDPITYGGYDGLTSNGANVNEGAESTLALITTMQYAPSRSVTAVPVPFSELSSIG